MIDLGLYFPKMAGCNFSDSFTPPWGVTFQKWATRADPTPSSTNNEPILMILVSF